MPNNGYKKGYRFESHIVQVLRKRGMYAQRTAGSHGPYDVVAHDEKNVYLIQAKDHKKKSNFTEDVQKMRMFKGPSCAIKQLWTKDGREIRIINVSDKKGGSNIDVFQTGKQEKTIPEEVQEVQDAETN